ncbi:hypothetical protein JW905_06855, partial [bacterium]|nr:hypothetical protein [candidate division CSSED10-310 bacterium]
MSLDELLRVVFLATVPLPFARFALSARPSRRLLSVVPLLVIVLLLTGYAVRMDAPVGDEGETPQVKV